MRSRASGGAWDEYHGICFPGLVDSRNDLRIILKYIDLRVIRLKMTTWETPGLHPSTKATNNLAKTVIMNF